MIKPSDPRLTSLLSQLTLEEKVLLLTGRDFWTTWPLEKIGLRRMLLSDGPSGVRGEFWDERDPSLNLPSATALSASWDIDLAYRYGAAAAVEARRKHVDIVLGPTINLHRSPLGGRHFEAFSEDPLLTADLAAAYVNGLQDNGVAATPKHYIANDFETDRFTADVQVSDRALRELYLLAFEKAIVESRAWLVMSSYNSINGATATENDLLESPLNSEWGFDGVVVSDWTGVRSVNSARFSQDLAMPGPVGAWGDALVEAVRDGSVEIAHVDRKVLRLLALAARVGALAGFENEAITPSLIEDGVAFTRLAEAEGIVLVSNKGILPLETAPQKIAVIGHNAILARTLGGGSATVLPERVVNPLEAIKATFSSCEISYSVGAIVQKGVAQLPLVDLLNPQTQAPGVRADFLDASGAVIYGEDRLSTELVWLGSAAPVESAAVLRLMTTWTPTETTTVNLGFAAVGHARITVNGEIVVDESVNAQGDDLGAALLSPGTASQPLDVVAGAPLQIVVEYTRVAVPQFAGAMMFSFGLDAIDTRPEELLAEAELAASMADVVILVVGTNSAVESEGFDRTDLALPGRQDELIARVLAANSHTVLVVNSGAPVEIPQRDDAAAVLLTWFGGQEFGNALTDVLTGAREPGGRLPTTWPDVQSDVPVIDVTPRDGVVRYDEGIHIGYRAWLKAGVVPAYPFGFGLGYTSWALTESAVTIEKDGVWVVTAQLANTGERFGKQVVQVYASRAVSKIDRPVRWLVGFAVARVEPGQSETVSIEIPRRAFANWEDGWQYEAGEYVLSVGFSIGELIEHNKVQF